MSNESSPSPRFAGSYPVTLAVAVIALIPFIVDATAGPYFENQIGAALRLSPTLVEIVAGLASGGYALGAVVGGDITQRFRQRHLFLVCELMFIVGALGPVLAHGLWFYAGGRILEGFATGLLLVIALPPVIRQFPPARMPITAIAVNIGFFGATTAGPVIGGAVAGQHLWREFYLVLAAMGALNWAAAFITLPSKEAFHPGQPFDFGAIALALAATMLPFWASGELRSHALTSRTFLVPCLAGVACLVALILLEYRKDEPLAPVKPMWNTYPVGGTLVAMMAGAAFIAFLELTEQLMMEVGHRLPAQVGWSYWPAVPALLAISLVLGALLRTRGLPLLILAGLLMLAGAGTLLLHLRPTGGGPLTWAAVLLGAGAGATVGPGLWMAGFSLPSKLVGRTLALIELVRSETDFLLAPILVRLARDTSGTGFTPAGIHRALLSMLALLWISIAAIVLIYLTGMGRRLPTPDLDAWLRRDSLALTSPPFGAALRH